MTRIASHLKRRAKPGTAPPAADEFRAFVPGTSGWSVKDLDDPRIEAAWSADAYEIIEGVLTTMPPAYYFGSSKLGMLERQIERHADRFRLAGMFTAEVDVVVADGRVVRPDSIWMTPADEAKNVAAARRLGKADEKQIRVYVPPPLIIEAVSAGHERHDRQTKLKFYAEFGVPNYWVFEPLQRSLECFSLARGKYAVAATGTAPSKIDVPYFDGLKIDLGAIFSVKR